MRVDGTLVGERGNRRSTFDVGTHEARLQAMTEACRLERKMRPRRNSRSNWTLERQILSDITKLILDRHKGPCNTDDGELYLQAALPSLIMIAGGLNAENIRQKIDLWAQKWVPRLTEKMITDAVIEVTERNKRFKFHLTAKQRGNLLKLTTNERKRLGIKTIRPDDQTTREFKAGQRADRAASEKVRRIARGARPRERSAARLQPWKDLNICKATYYRWKAEGRLPNQLSDYETNSWPVGTKYLTAVSEESHVAQPIVLGGPTKGAPSLIVADGLSPGDQTKAVPNDHTRVPPLSRADIHEQRDLFGGLGDWKQLGPSLSAYKRGVLPPDLIRAVREELRARLLTQDALANQIGFSRSHLANSLGGRSGLSRTSAANLMKWLTREWHP